MRFIDLLQALPLVHRVCEEEGERVDAEIERLTVLIESLEEVERRSHLLRQRLKADGFLVDDVRVDNRLVDYCITIDNLKRSRPLRAGLR